MTGTKGCSRIPICSFLQGYIDRWSELRTNVLATSNVLARIDRHAGELSEAQVRNYQRWPRLGQYVHPNKFIGRTYEEEVDWLKRWVAGRLAWIDSQDFPSPQVRSMASTGITQLETGDDQQSRQNSLHFGRLGPAPARRHRFVESHRIQRSDSLDEHSARDRSEPQRIQPVERAHGGAEVRRGTEARGRRLDEGRGEGMSRACDWATLAS